MGKIDADATLFRALEAYRVRCETEVAEFKRRLIVNINATDIELPVITSMKQLAEEPMIIQKQKLSTFKIIDDPVRDSPTRGRN